MGTMQRLGYVFEEMADIRGWCCLDGETKPREDQPLSVGPCRYGEAREAAPSPSVDAGQLAIKGIGQRRRE